MNYLTKLFESIRFSLGLGLQVSHVAFLPPNKYDGTSDFEFQICMDGQMFPKIHPCDIANIIFVPKHWVIDYPLFSIWGQRETSGLRFWQYFFSYKNIGLLHNLFKAEREYFLKRGRFRRVALWISLVLPFEGWCLPPVQWICSFTGCPIWVQKYEGLYLKGKSFF